MQYRTVTAEATALEAVIADRYPAMSAADRAAFPASVLYKVADLYRPNVTVVLQAYDGDGRQVGSRPLVEEDL